jgi:hypothetical protein
MNVVVMSVSEDEGSDDESVVGDIIDPPGPRHLGSHWEAGLSNGQNVHRAAPLSEGFAVRGSLGNYLLLEVEILVSCPVVGSSFELAGFGSLPVR